MGKIERTLKINDNGTILTVNEVDYEGAVFMSIENLDEFNVDIVLDQEEIKALYDWLGNQMFKPEETH